MARGRPREFVREEALDRALDAFWERGYSATGLGDLTEAMGIGRQSLYDTFGDKKSLYLEALSAYCDRQYAQMEAVVKSEASPGKGLAAFLGSWEATMSGPLKNGCLVLNTVGETPIASDAEIVKALAGHVDRMGRFVEDIVQAAMDSGEVTVALKAREVAAMIAASAQGISMRARIQDASLAAADASRALIALLGLN